MGQLTRWTFRAITVAMCTLAPALHTPTAVAAMGAPTCRPALHFGFVGDWCSWKVAPDPANAFLASFGQCTYWALERRPEIWSRRSPHDSVHDWDAGTWADHARTEGLPVGSLPEAGDLAVWTPAQAGDPSGPGHVAYVESVDASGSVLVSEMNHVYGTRAGDDDVLYDAPVAQGGWRGLQFIHRRGTLDAHAASAAHSAPERVTVTSSLWSRGRYTVTVRLSGPGTVHADAARGARDVHLRATSRGRIVKLSALLDAGSWKLTVWAVAPGAAYPSVSPYAAVLALR